MLVAAKQGIGVMLVAVKHRRDSTADQVLRDRRLWSAVHVCDVIRNIVKMVARRMAAWVLETLPATAPAEATPAINRHWAMASEILAKTKGERKLFDKPRRRLKYLNSRMAGTCGPVDDHISIV